MSEHKTTGWEALALILLVPFSAAWNGLILVKLWAWFIVGTFGLQPLRIPQALGVSLVVGFLTAQTNNAKEKHSTVESIGIAFIFPLFALFFGWIYHLFL